METIVLCNWPKEQDISPLLSAMEIERQIFVDGRHSQMRVAEILSQSLEEGENAPLKQAMLFFDVPMEKVSHLIDQMRLLGFAPCLKGMVTETNLDWSLGVLLRHYEEEKARAERAD